MEHTNTQYKNLKFREHVRLRPDMYIGSNLSTENTLWVWDSADGCLVKRQMAYPIALYNICDEIILNALDHCLRTKGLRGKNKCTQVHLSFDQDSGEISCFNNGEGIVVEKVEGGDMFIPEMIFTKEMSGSNFENDGAETIGMNGIGSKATNILSTKFVIETMDAKNKKHYVQEVLDGCATIMPPTIKAGKGAPFTRISFTPDFSYFNTTLQEISPVLSVLLETRMLYVSTYLGKGFDVRMNGKAFEVYSLETLAASVRGCDAVVKCPLTSKEPDEKTMEVLIGIYDCENSVEHLSFINGLYLSEGGTHIRVVVKILLEALKSKLEKKLKGKMSINPKLIGQHLMVFFSANMTKLAYKNQSKNELSISETRFKHYSMDKTGVKKVWEMLECKIDELYLSKMMANTTTKKVNDLRGVKKYRSADCAGTAKSQQCCLFIPEGDSAESCIKNGLTSNKSLGFKFNGMFNIQGVPLNVRKAVDVKTFQRGDELVTMLDRKKEIADNDRISSLVKVLNLNYHHTYDESPEGDKQLETLRYGSVVIATDADVDGLGNICGLLLNFFDLFFPALLKRKYVKLLATPLIRAYPKRTSKGKGKVMVEEFYTAEEYDAWCRRSDVRADDYAVNYIKGLATHSNVEITHMFKRMESNVYTFGWDPSASNLFEIYFGKDADKRKIILSSPVDTSTNVDIRRHMMIPCAQHLNNNTKEYQLDNIQRKLPHEIDGLNPARRKVLCGSILKFKGAANKLKVFQLGGYVAEKMAYHHGSASLNDTIVNMAQNFCGARNIPLLLPIGQFGTHYKGGKDAGSPRYIDTALNRKVVELMYPYCDMDLLEWTVVDGEKAEPKFFIPVLPMGIMEDLSLPATGWKVEIWARDIKAVVKNVRSMVEGLEAPYRMAYWSNKFKGCTFETPSSIFFIGKYSVARDAKKPHVKITITALPPKMWIDKFVEECQENPLVLRVSDNSSISNVSIEVLVHADTLDLWKASQKKIKCRDSVDAFLQAQLDTIDHVHQGLKIYRVDSHLINMYSMEDTVVEYPTYEAAMLRWFGLRKTLYIDRIERERLLLTCKKTMLQNQGRFIASHEAYGLSKMQSDQEQCECLLLKGFVPVNTAMLSSPGQTPNDQLVSAILPAPGGDMKHFNYLLNMSYRQMNASAAAAITRSQSEISSRLQILEQTDAWKSTWLSEIDTLMSVLEDGISTGFYKEDPELFK
jgi:DNA gyrase/topoisomerase IV subunit B